MDHDGVEGGGALRVRDVAVHRSEYRRVRDCIHVCVASNFEYRPVAVRVDDLADGFQISEPAEQSYRTRIQESYDEIRRLETAIRAVLHYVNFRVRPESFS